MNDCNILLARCTMFFENALLIFEQVLILAVIVTVGFFGDRFGFFKESTARACNNLLFYVVTPCVIVNSFLGMEFTKENAGGFFAAFACMLVFHALGALLGFFVFNKGEKDRKIVYKYSVTYGNAGYMGLPLSMAVMSALTGDGTIGAFYCSAAVACFNLFAFTHGVWLMSGGGKFDLKKLIINPGTLSILVGMPLFLLKVSLPDIITAPITHLASMNTPLAMVMFGTYISKADFKTLFRDKNVYFLSLIKLILTPLVMITAFRLCGIAGNLLVVMSIVVAAPVANNTVMFSAKFDRDVGLASQICSFTSILAIITMPLCTAYAIMIS